MIKYFKENQIANKVRKGQLTKLTKLDKAFIIKKFMKNLHLSVVKVTAEFNEKFSI